MSTPTPTSDRPFVCDCEDSMRTACAGEPFYGCEEGKQYCVLHFPGDKSTFWDALDKKLSRGDFNFRGVWFPGCTPFKDVRFTRDVDFESACFSGEVDFDRSTFEGNADFSQAMFRGGAYFSGVTFKSVNFSGATFSLGALFVDATFALAKFQHTMFSGQGTFVRVIFEGDVDFSGVTFEQEDRFDSADFSGAIFRRLTQGCQKPCAIWQSIAKRIINTKRLRDSAIGRWTLAGVRSGADSGSGGSVGGTG